MAADYGAVTVASTATQIFAPNNSRRGFVIYNNGANTIYLGLDANVTTASGIPVLPNGPFTVTGERDTFKGSIYGIVASGTSDCRYWNWTP